LSSVFLFFAVRLFGLPAFSRSVVFANGIKMYLAMNADSSPNAYFAFVQMTIGHSGVSVELTQRLFEVTLTAGFFHAAILR